MVTVEPGWRGWRRVLRIGTTVVCCSNVRRRGAEDNLGTDSYDLRERLEVSRSLKRIRRGILHEINCCCRGLECSKALVPRQMEMVKQVTVVFYKSLARVRFLLLSGNPSSYGSLGYNLNVSRVFLHSSKRREKESYALHPKEVHVAETKSPQKENHVLHKVLTRETRECQPPSQRGYGEGYERRVGCTL